MARLHAGRVVTDLRRSWPDDDIADPIGRSSAEYEAMLDEVATLTGRLAELLAATPGMVSRGPSVGPTREGIGSDRLPPLSIEAMSIGDKSDSPESGPTARDDLQADVDENVKERSMAARDLDGDGGTDTLGPPAPRTRRMTACARPGRGWRRLDGR